MKTCCLIKKLLRLPALLGAALALLPSAPAVAQVSYTGGTYTQDFESLANTGSAVPFVDASSSDPAPTLAGWYVDNYDTGYATGEFTTALLFAGTKQAQSGNYTPGTGSSNAGNLYSFGIAGTNPVTDRALGTVGSGTPDDFFTGVAIKNSTGLPLASFTVTYDGEQWRLGGNTTQRAETVYAYYRVVPSTTPADFDATGTWTPVTALNFTSPNVSATTTAGSALDGNAVGNRTAGITATIAVPVQPDDTIWILWVDLDHPGSDHGMAIDNFQFTAATAIAGAPVINSSTTPPNTNANSLFEYQISATNSPTSFGASDLPAWLSINTSTGLLSGTPPVPGSFPITVSATNASGTGAAVVIVTITPDPKAPVITTGQSISQLINTPVSYQLQLEAASDRPAPTSYTIGTLPTGLTFDTATGLISGTPTAPATFTNIPVTATNAFGTGSGTINVSIVSPPIFTGDYAVSAYAGATGASHTLTFSQTVDSYEFIGLEPTGWQNLSGATLSGTITSTPGTYEITVRAINTHGTTEVVINLIVLDTAAQDAIPQNVVINKYVNGDPDQIELLVVGNNTPGSTVDMRGMILKDFSNSMLNDGGGRFTFAQNSLWSAVPAGTLIVLSAGTTQPQDLSPSDYVLRINLGDTNYFISAGGFDIATTDMIMLKDGSTGTAGVAGGIHLLAAGTTTNTLYTRFQGPKIAATTTTGFGFGVFATNPNSQLTDYNGTSATGNTALASLTFGAANNSTNQAYIDFLRAPTVTPVEAWRSANFPGSTATEGVGADTADFDGDGLSNLLEYATDLDPVLTNTAAKVAGASPVVVGTVTTVDGTRLTLTYPKNPNATDLTYTVKATNDLGVTFTTGTGTTVVTGDTVTYTDNVILNSTNSRRFLLLEVSY